MIRGCLAGILVFVINMILVILNVYYLGLWFIVPLLSDPLEWSVKNAIGIILLILSIKTSFVIPQESFTKRDSNYNIVFELFRILLLIGFLVLGYFLSKYF